MTKVKTSLINMNGSWYVLIPQTLAKGFGLIEAETVMIEDKKNKAIITFPEFSQKE